MFLAYPSWWEDSIDLCHETSYPDAQGRSDGAGCSEG